LDDALTAYQRAMELGSGSPTMWLAMAHTLDMLSRPLEAVQVIDQYQLPGALADAIRGNAFRQQGRLDKALQMYQRAVAQNDQNQWFYHLLTLTYKDLGRTADAVAAWRQSLRVSPGFGPAVEGLRSLGEK
jgi:tetratricopeptide (TPR) repeat protein